MDKIILDNQREINKLTKVLGVLPVYLLHNQEQSSGKYALLNGNYNNFCIDYKNEFSPMKAEGLTPFIFLKNLMR